MSYQPGPTGGGASFDITLQGTFLGPISPILRAQGTESSAALTSLSQKKKKIQRKCITVPGGKTAGL